MAITFFTQSKKEIAPIWIRFRSPSADAKSRTNLTIDNGRIKNSRVVKYKASSSDNRAKKNLLIQKNLALEVVQAEMTILELRVRTLSNQLKEYEVINSRWLKRAVQPQLTHQYLQDHINVWLKTKRSLKPNSYRKYETLKIVIEGFERFQGNRLNLIEIDLKFRDVFEEWMGEEGYSLSSQVDYISLLKQALKFSHKRGETVHKDYMYLTDGLKKKKTLKVFLSTKEIKSIIDLDLKGQEAIARDWLVVSCYTGQRYTSFSKFTKEDIKNGAIEWQQIKNDQSFPVIIPILPQVQDVLDKYNGNFPPNFLDNESSNYTQYNRLIKRVCKKAELDDVEETLVSKTPLGSNIPLGVKTPSRKQVKSHKGTKPKWKLVSSHIGRRSFATNLFGKIPTEQIKQITGHETESSFLLYIDKRRAVDTDKLKEDMIKAFE
jgi:integrase